MMVTLDGWKSVRHLFNELEKDLLNGAVVGETICPRGMILNEAAMSKELALKLREALNDAKKGAK